MFKKRLALMMVLIMILSMMMSSVFALDSSKMFEHSDRYSEIGPEGEELGKGGNPFGAVYAPESMYGEDTFSLMSLPEFSPQLLMTEEPKTVVEKAYGHIVYITTNIGTRVTATVYEEQAGEYIKEQFQRIGYETTLQPFTHTREGTNYPSNNIIAIKPGISSKQVIVGAHYDSVPNAIGADDNASGVGVMLEVAEMLKHMETDYTIKFIAFGAEEEGLGGSTYHANKMTEEEIENTVGMINLDSLIAGDKMYVHGGIITDFNYSTEQIRERYGSEEDGWIRDQALALAETWNLNVETNPGLDIFDAFPAGSTGAWSDHAPFAKVGIPVAAFEASNWEEGDKDGYNQTAAYGPIWHTDMDNLDFLMEKFPGRVEERLETFTTLLYQLLLNIAPPDEAEEVGVTLSNNFVSLTEERDIEVVVNLGYLPNLDDLEWTLGELTLSQWQKYNSSQQQYTGAPFITFTEEPYIDKDYVKATLSFGLPYDTANLSGGAVRRRIEDLIGNYDFTVKDTIEDIEVSTPLKINVYDTYHKYDEIKPAIEKIIDSASSERYLEYKSLGKSYEGREIPFVMVAKSKADLDTYQNQLLPTMLENPKELMDKIDNGTIGKYKPVIWFNNLHPDETPGVDAQMELIERLAKEDIIEFKTKDADGNEVTIELDVEEILENFIFLFLVTQNPDGRYHTTRGTVTGFDLNRDMSFQTQVETKVSVAEIAQWSPMIFNDLHGFVSAFLIEPCTPPHEPNFEYDILMDGMFDHAHAMGTAGISNTKYDNYVIAKDYYSSGWDDASIVYGAMYAMMQGAMGHTIEIPELNGHSHDAFVYAGLGSIKHVLDNKDKLFRNQLEIYRRGVNGEDNRAVDSYLVRANGEEMGRLRGENENFFPEYYVMPINSSLQKNNLATYEMVEYLLRNGVKVEKSTQAVTVGEITYPAGAFIIPMRQAKRGYANAVLYDGVDYSDWSAMYAETTALLHDMRGFDRYEVRTAGVFGGKTNRVTEVTIPTSIVQGNAVEYVIQNTNNDVIKAVNKLLSKGKQVRMIYGDDNEYEKGDFVVSKVDLETVKDNYYLETIPYSKTTKTKLLQKSKVVVYNSELNYVVDDLLGFNRVDSYTEADIIVDATGNANAGVIKTAIQNGAHYIGIGGNAIASMQSSNLLPGVERGRTAASSYEGALRAIVDTDHVITGRYQEEEILFNKSASWIASVPTTSTVLATIVDRDDYFKAGWWRNHSGVRGKAYIISDKVGDSNVTLFANHIHNRAHPQHQFRMLANAIYDATAIDYDLPEDPSTPSRSSGGSSTPSNRISALRGGTVTAKGVSVVLSTNAISRDVTITIDRLTNVSSLPFSGTLKLVGDVFEITKDVAGSFDKPVTITLPFDKSKVDMDKYRIAIFWLDEETNEWIELDNIGVDLKNGTVSGDTDHFTKFAVLALEKTTDDVLEEEKPADEVQKEEKPAVSFIDIKGHWAESNIERLVELGAISGYSDGSFKPSNNITRAEFATVLVKAFGFESTNGKIFNDTANHWAKDYIAAAAEHGIVSGYNDTTFGANDSITREQMTIMIVKATKLEITEGTTSFIDRDQISSWALGAVNTASENNIISGYQDNTYRPKANATRAEAVTVIVKSLF
ncbi:peptidase M28 [Alkaliphilus metalliredigens QYMF]|uniref:Peptidase M28 n=1 Tax=Alkaliphilus metalliredigens (strain QYMF) TaxID=293826 RepID=A6TTZ7_ALKMQ|nr:M20/M25/M40 family metallo-hydrolase [Alkaliphilus metalliredigens]ABR49665.1 peptidase M28 [Alkaliphilus metalliredigens QYMF]